jgi:hypothetical protein
MERTMNTRYEPCNSDDIERFLSDQLSADELAAFEGHLERCAVCRRELDAHAADDGWWSQARDCLAASKLRTVSGSGAAPHVGDGTRSWDGHAPELTAEIQSALAIIKPYLAPTDDPHMVGRVGPYEIVGLIGSGGNGIVLKGFDAALHRYVAVKLLSPRLADSGAARRRFSREAQAAAAVVHDNVMAIHAVAETQGLPYLVMPYVRGPSLEKRLRSAGPLALEEILRVGMQVAAGLSAAHAQGLVHRDIKPANILLEDGVERVKITDFGLARAADDASLTRSGVIAGTPQYMSPEQARGEPLDHRADLFSLGCVLYAICTGRSPFRAETSYGVLRKICESEPSAVREVNPAVPVWLEMIITRLLAKDPAGRYGSAAEVADLLERCLAHVQQPATVHLPPELVEPAPRWAWRTWINARRIVAAVATLLVASITVVALRGPDAERRETGTVRQNREPVPPRSANRAGKAMAATHVSSDDIDEQLQAAASDIDHLQADFASDFEDDVFGASLDKLHHDAERLEKEVVGDTANERNEP